MPQVAKSVLVWSETELKQARDHAEHLFKAKRNEEGPEAFKDVCSEIEPKVRAALDATDNLRALTGDPLKADPLLFQTLRYFCGPPISEEDLWTLVGGPKFKKMREEWADDTAEVIAPVIDPVRFPWVLEERNPTQHELETAVTATTVILANREVATGRRGTASAEQEAAVGAVLGASGFTFDVVRTAIEYPDNLERGHYSKERKVGDAKCDVPVRLHDGRLLALECKVSNGPKNGWKRVAREVCGKAEAWKTKYGTQVVTAVVLAGVFDLKCLKDAQDQGVMLFWQHDLAPLHDFVVSAGTPA